MPEGEISEAKERGRAVMATARQAIERDKHYRKQNGLEPNRAAKDKAISDVRNHAPLAKGWSQN